MQNYFIIDLKRENFFFGGSVYLEKTIKEPTARSLQKEMDEMEANGKLTDPLASMSLLSQSYISKQSIDGNNYLRNKLFENFDKVRYNDFDQLTIDEDELNSLRNEYVKGDKIIFLHKNETLSGELYDTRTTSLFVICYNDDQFRFGIPISKLCFQFLFDRKGDGVNV